MPLRTGYEKVIAHRTDDMFAADAAQDGVVENVDARAITVTYKDGSKHSVQLGRRYGTVAALTLPHEIVTNLKVGDKVKAGDIIAYNNRYFDPDPLDKSSVLFKFGSLLTVALMESSDTLEDSCALSEHASKLLESDVVEVRSIVVNFKDTIHNLVQEGTDVEVDDILCTIEDPVTAQSNLFDDDSIETLRLLAMNNPKAKFKGQIEKVEFLYNGDIDDLSPTLLEIAQESNLVRKRYAKSLNIPYASGRVDGSLNIEGSRLQPGTAVIRVYIAVKRNFAIGDKGVFGNQLKTVCGRIMHGINRTESGEDIDAIFGYLSISDRIVRSPEIMGTTNKLMELITKRALAAYKEGK